MLRRISALLPLLLCCTWFYVLAKQGLFYTWPHKQRWTCLPNIWLCPAPPARRGAKAFCIADIGCWLPHKQHKYLIQQYWASAHSAASACTDSSSQRVQSCLSQLLPSLKLLMYSDGTALQGHIFVLQGLPQETLPVWMFTFATLPSC